MKSPSNYPRPVTFLSELDYIILTLQTIQGDGRNPWFHIYNHLPAPVRHPCVGRWRLILATNSEDLLVPNTILRKWLDSSFSTKTLAKHGERNRIFFPPKGDGCYFVTSSPK